MEEDLPPLKNFILPGGHPTVSYCHIARCVCRRAERSVVALNSTEEVSSILIQYLNRLSDYLFVLSRWIGQKLDAEELPWIPNKKGLRAFVLPIFNRFKFFVTFFYGTVL